MFDVGLEGAVAQRAFTVFEVLVEEPQASQTNAVQEKRPLGVRYDEFGRAAADVEDARHPAADRITAADAQMNEPRFVGFAENLDRNAARGTDRREELLAIARFAHRRRRDRAHVRSARRASGFGEFADRGDAALHGFLTQVTARECLAAA